MRIADITTHVLTKTTPDPPWNPRTRWSKKTVLLVRVVTDEGIIGIGEAWCDGSSPRSTIALIEDDISPLIIGMDALCTEAVFTRIVDTTVVSGKRGISHSAASAVDIALWDIKGKVANLPIWKLLGGYSDRVTAYASGGLYKEKKGPEALAKEMTGYISRGFHGVKIKIGGLPIGLDIERVAAVRKAIGADVRLMVDALYSYKLDEAKEMAAALEPYRVHFFEAPISSYDVDGLTELARVSKVPIAGNEIEYGRHAFARLIRQRAVSVVHVDAILCGGITEAMKICALAAADNLCVSFHNSSSAVAFASNLQVAAAIANCESLEYHMIHRILFDKLPPDYFEPQDGLVIAPDRPGLGISPDLVTNPQPDQHSPDR